MPETLVQTNIFYENIILIPVITIIITIVLKWIVFKLLWKKDHVSLALWSGWMPSAHSSFVSSLTTAIAIKHWIDSDLFALALVIAVVVIYDAINVRYEAWLHAKAMNKNLWSNFKESLWHLPSEAFAWSILWIIVAVILKVI